MRNIMVENGWIPEAKEDRARSRVARGGERRNSPLFLCLRGPNLSASPRVPGHRELEKIREMRPFEHSFASLFLSLFPFVFAFPSRLSRSCRAAQFLTPTHARGRAMKQSHLLHASLVSSSCNHDFPSISA